MNMMVVDASVLVFALAGQGELAIRARDLMEKEDKLCAPECVYVETYSGLRKQWLTKRLSEKALQQAIVNLMDMPLETFSTRDLLPRQLHHRHNISAYDSSYVALAEGLRCALLTADQKLAQAPFMNCSVEVL
jgi:predicted nucleic acid-binding protein